MSFCWTAVASRVEWMALRQLSTGKIKGRSRGDNKVLLQNLTWDYQIPDKQNKVFKKWSAADAKPVSDLVKIRKSFKGTSIIPNVAFMMQIHSQHLLKMKR